MARTRLTDAEREERRRERSRHSFSDAAYRKYNPRTEGYGSAEQWYQTAEAAFGDAGVFRRMPGADAKITTDMQTLGLVAMPDDMAGLKKAFRKAMMSAHPDQGGTNAAAIATKQAFERLAVQYS